MGHQGTVRVFGKRGFDVTYTVDNPGSLGQALGDGPARRASVQLATPSATVTLLGEELTLDAGLTATALVHERGWAVDAFDPEVVAGPERGRVAELRLEADLSAETEASLRRPPWALSLRAAGQTRLATRHLLPIPDPRTLGEALQDLLGSVQSPLSLRLDHLAEGELHTLEANLGLDLGLTLGRGFERDVTFTLLAAFEDTPVSLAAHLEGLVRAAVGAGLQEELSLEVGRVGAAFPGRVRIRLRRKHQGSLTFGANLALRVAFDLGSSLVAVLDRALELLPLRRLMGAVGEVSRALASGGDDWAHQVSTVAARQVGELVDEQGWLDRYATDPRVRRLVRELATLADTWERLDDTVTSFWEHVLSSATGGQTATVRAVLELLAALDPGRLAPDDLLGGRYRQAITLVETFSGHSLEELLAGSRDELEAHLAQAARLASDALRLLDLDQEVLGKLHAFAQKTGIEACVAWIDTHATSVKKLRALATSTIEGLVEKLLGKTLDQVGAADLQALRRWATRTSRLLDRKEAWEQGLRAEMARLQGDLGCSVGLEVGRLLRRTALVDLEVDPAGRGLCRAVERALAAADVRALLEALPAEPSHLGPPPSSPFLLRECAFASRRERWVTGSWLLGSLTGETRRRRVVESALHVTQGVPPDTAAPRALTRRATYTGGFVRGVNGSAAVTFDAGVWLDLAATGSGHDVTAPYDSVERSLRLTVLRHDLATSTSLGEPSATVRLLADLGLAPANDAARAFPDLDGQETSLAIRISLPHDALDALVHAAADERAWSTAFVNAGLRWLEPGLEENEARDLRMHRGAICRALMLTPSFRTNWTRWADVGKWAPALPAIRRAAGQPIRPRKPFKQGRWQPDFLPLGGLVGAAGGPAVDGLVSWRPESMARLQALARTAPATTTRPDELLAACDRFAALFAATPGGWEEPLFGLWLLLALLLRSHPEALAGATGLATLRWRPRKADPWQGPAVWRLPGHGLHLPDDPQHRQVFPL